MSAAGIPPAAVVQSVAGRLSLSARRLGDRRLGRRLSRDVQPGCGAVESEVVRTVSDTLLVYSRGAADLVIKCPMTTRARASLEKQYAVLRELEADERLGDWRRLLPSVVSCELRGARPLAVERLLPGLNIRDLIDADAGAAGRATDAALEAVARLHRATGRYETVGAGHLARWIDAPLGVIRRELAPCRTEWGRAALDALGERLYDGFAGRRILVSWTHGDYHPGNVLVSADAERVTGIVDWPTALRDGPAPVDARLFTLAVRRQIEGREFGDLVVREWRRGRARLSDSRAEDSAAEDAVLLLTWLRHVAANTELSMRYHRNWRWLTRNVVPVLQEVSR